MAVSLAFDPTLFSREEACRSADAPDNRAAFEVQGEQLLALISIYFRCHRARTQMLPTGT